MLRCTQALALAHHLSVHISCVGNTLYAHETSKQPSLNDANQTCEELKLNALEHHFSSMKVKYKEKQTDLAYIKDEPGGFTYSR